MQMIECDTQARIDVPQDAQGRVSPNDVEIVAAKFILAKGTDVEAVFKKIYAACPEVMFWATSRIKKENV